MFAFKDLFFLLFFFFFFFFAMPMAYRSSWTTDQTEATAVTMPSPIIDKSPGNSLRVVSCCRFQQVESQLFNTVTSPFLVYMYEVKYFLQTYMD